MTSTRGSVIGLLVFWAVASVHAATECDGEHCDKVDTWCPAKRCGAYRLDGVNIRGARNTDWGKVCLSIQSAMLRNVEGTGSQAYCQSDDISTLGFRCFRGSTWAKAISSFLSVDFDTLGVGENENIAHLQLNQSACENLNVRDSKSGVAFMSGYCCVGQAVPCPTSEMETCANGFEPRGPSWTNSLVSIMLAICAVVHILSAAMCIVFAERLIDDTEGTEDMAPSERAAFKNIIGMLGAAHGGFAALLIFGALQDWLYGMRQVGIAAMTWYGLLGPIAEAMQHGSRPYGCRHYLTVLISVSQGECGGRPPKINYLILSLLLLLAVGVETIGNEFIVGATMIVMGFIISLVISQWVVTGDGSDADEDDERPAPSKRGGAAELR